MICTLIKPFGKVSVTKDTQLVLDLSQAFLKANNCDLNIFIEGEGVNLEVLGMYSLFAQQNAAINIKITHVVPNTKSTTEVKGVLYDNAQSSFVGTIKIPQQAQKTDASLHHDVITLGVRCKNESQPILIIDANDVKATHGSTTGPLSTSQLFYLQSRGFTSNQAQKILLEGFFASLLDKILDEDIKLKVASDLGIKNE